jgi:iron(III) transport system ATP-binding protein
MSETMIIELCNVSKRFAGHSAVRDLSFTVARGELLALLGPSGCGKTTTLRLIAGLETPDAGEIVLAGRRVAGPGAWVPPERRRVGMVFQDYALFPHLTVADNIAFSLDGAPGERRRARAADLMHLVGLDGLGDRRPHQLSGGQQQRVALARALAPEPAVILLDEPFSNLDADRRAQMRAQVRSILKKVGATAVFVTHDQEEALFMGDRIAVLHVGQLEQVAAPEELYLAPASRFVAEFMGATFFLPAVVTPFGLETEIGFVPQPVTLKPGTQVEVAVRPDDLTLAPDGSAPTLDRQLQQLDWLDRLCGPLPDGHARILNRVFRGDAYLYEVRLPSGAVVRCQGPHTERHAPGSPVRVTLTPGHPLAYFAASSSEMESEGRGVKTQEKKQ